MPARSGIGRPALRAVAAGLAALAACAPPKLPEGQYFGLVAAREAVVVAGAAGPTPAWQWTVKLDGGRKMTLVQAAPMVAIGQRVRVVTDDGAARMEIP